jgi:heptosyltransferase II
MRSLTDKMHGASKIVVRGTNWVGDTIISLPAARRLRTLFPSASITYWIKDGLAPLVKAAGIADDVISFGEARGGPLVRSFRMTGKVGAPGFHIAVLFQNAFESAFTAWMARIPLRIGYPTDLRGPLLSVSVPLNGDVKQRHQVFYYLAITDFIAGCLNGGAPVHETVPDCSIVLGMHHLIRARDLLVDLGVDLNRPLFCLCPGSANSDAKRWPTDYFARLADLLIDKMEAAVVFVGSSGERELVEQIRGQMRNCGSVSLAGSIGMVRAMVVMGLARMVISNDTGSAHLAVAASAKVLTVFGPTSPGATAPYGPDAHIIQGEAPCAPCRHFRCPRPDHLCMRNLDPIRVYSRVEEILSGSHVSPQSSAGQAFSPVVD